MGRAQLNERRIMRWCKSPEQEAQIRALVADGWRLEFTVGEIRDGQTQEVIFLSRGVAAPLETRRVDAAGRTGSGENEGGE